MSNEDYIEEADETDSIDTDPEKQLEDDGMNSAEAGFQEGAESWPEESEEEEEKPLDDFEN